MFFILRLTLKKRNNKYNYHFGPRQPIQHSILWVFAHLNPIRRAQKPRVTFEILRSDVIETMFTSRSVVEIATCKADIQDSYLPVVNGVK